MPKVIWLNEAEAAKLMNYKPETLRKLAKSGKLDIPYTTVRNRKYHYDKLSIEKEMLAHSNLMK